MTLSPRSVVAELLGTFTLTLVVALGAVFLGADLGIPVPYLAGITLGLFVYTVGWISGAHLNPAVTIALATVKKVSLQDAVAYILAQFAGAALASYSVLQLTGESMQMSLGGSGVVVLLAEAVGAFILAFGVMSVVEGKTSTGASGLVVGSSLALGALIAYGMGSNGVVNPAVAFGIHSFSVAYLFGPIIGAIAAAWLYRWFLTSDRTAPMR